MQRSSWLCPNMRTSVTPSPVCHPVSSMACTCVWRRTLPSGTACLAGSYPTGEPTAAKPSAWGWGTHLSTLPQGLGKAPIRHSSRWAVTDTPPYDVHFGFSIPHRTESITTRSVNDNRVCGGGACAMARRSSTRVLCCLEAFGSSSTASRLHWLSC